MLTGVVGAAFFGPSATEAADLVLKAPALLAKAVETPAVDGFNAKFEALGGRLSHMDLYGSRVAFSVPVAPSG